MVQFIPPPDPQALLPPILACIPTAFISPRPPPALIPLLSPILRQRIQYVGATSTSPSESWLPYLCWDPESAKRLVEIVSDSDAFEPHPTSGQIETGDVEPIKYRRLDEETLHARIAVPDTQLEVIFLWRAGEEGAEDSNVWLIAEVKPYSSVEGQVGYGSIAEAEEAADLQAFEDATRDDEDGLVYAQRSGMQDSTADEDDYWAQYDKTPARTPGHDRTPAEAERGRRGRTTSEAEYFDRYAEVQPEMDNDDPSQDAEDVGQSTLNGHEVIAPHRGNARSLQPVTQPSTENRTGSTNGLSQNIRTRSPTAEHTVEGQSLAVTATRQHVSANLKSLYKLCQGVGMEKQEFEELITRELQALSMLEDA